MADNAFLQIENSSPFKLKLVKVKKPAQKKARIKSVGDLRLKLLKQNKVINHNRQASKAQQKEAQLGKLRVVAKTSE